VQRRLLNALQGEPARRFTIEELATHAFNDEMIVRAHLVSVRRALKALPVDRCRNGRAGAKGWCYTIKYGG